VFEIPDSTIDNLERVEELLKRLLDDGTSVGRVALGTILAGGKRLRPLLLLLSCQSAGGAVDDRIIRVAAGVELVHTASLIHDDIMDEATLRRGIPTVFAEHGASQAIVVGDYLFVRGYAMAATALDDETVRIVADACSGLAEGQFAEEALKSEPNNPEKYLYVVERKTAGFIAACAELGAHLAGARGDQRQAYRDFGYNLGVAFQLIDDVLDVTGTVEALGKDVGIDSKAPLKGAPAVFAAGASHGHLGEVVHDLVSNEGVSKAQELAERFVGLATDAAERFPSNEYSKTLVDVAKVLLSRDR
jgi:geranylgeranyl pyrophosphate synthase